MQEQLVIPKMKIQTQVGESVWLPDFLQGKFTVLYFYPKDDTPGCTKQACAYRDQQATFTAKNAQIIGVSSDGIESHQNFIAKYDLPFTLLADTTKQLSEALGVWREQEWQGKKFQGTARDTFLLDEKATVVQVWRNVDPVQSVEESLKAISS